jgi:insertion element IS1 protein InsB
MREDKNYSQFPILRGINDHPAVLTKLLRALDELDARPINLLIPDPISYLASFRVSLDRLLGLMDNLYWTTSFWTNGVRLVLDTPIGKVRREDIKAWDKEKGVVAFERASPLRHLSQCQKPGTTVEKEIQSICPALSIHGAGLIWGIDLSALGNQELVRRVAHRCFDLKLVLERAGRNDAESDEPCGFVGKKADKQWLWLTLDAQSRQIIAFHVGDRSRHSARQLWKKLPAVYREHATFYTDAYQLYRGVIPKAQHRAITKKARKTNYVERFNCTLRQRLSRLVRSTLSFSEKLANHIGAIRYFICHYNLTRAVTLHG